MKSLLILAIFIFSITPLTTLAGNSYAKEFHQCYEFWHQNLKSKYGMQAVFPVKTAAGMGYLVRKSYAHQKTDGTNHYNFFFLLENELYSVSAIGFKGESFYSVINFCAEDQADILDGKVLNVVDYRVRSVLGDEVKKVQVESRCHDDVAKGIVKKMSDTRDAEKEFRIELEDELNWIASDIKNYLGHLEEGKKPLSSNKAIFERYCKKDFLDVLKKNCQASYSPGEIEDFERLCVKADHQKMAEVDCPHCKYDELDGLPPTSAQIEDMQDLLLKDN